MTRTFQIVKPFPEMTVTDNVLVGAFNHHADTGAARDKAAEVIALVGLGPQADKLGSELTVAGRKRVERIAVPSRRQPDHRNAEAVGDVQCLGPDRSGGAEDDEPVSAPGRSQINASHVSTTHTAGITVITASIRSSRPP